MSDAARIHTHRPRLLDRFCGAGGAAQGYHDAGFEVVGVDIAPQPHYPFEFHQADALSLRRDRINGCWHLPTLDLCLGYFDAHHASPVCHDWTPLASVTGKNGTAELLHQTLDMLRGQSAPWVVENVVGAPLARQDTLDGAYGVELCGTMFGLRVLRHRLFETSFPIPTPHHPAHVGTFYSIAGHGDPNWRQRDRYPEMRGAGYSNRCREAMGIDWMPRDVLAQSIPPAYTEFIGAQLLSAIGVAA